MAIPRALPATLGIVAALPTTAVVVIQIILARHPVDQASVRITAIIAAALETVVLIILSALTVSQLGRWTPNSRLGEFHGLWFGGGLLLCTAAAAVSVSNLISLSRLADDPLSSPILGAKVMDLLLVFLVSHFISGRIHGTECRIPSRADERRSRSPPRIKAIAYHETSPVSAKVRGSASFEWRSPPGSSSGRSETVSSIRSSLSQVVRPITSKTRLLSGSQRSSRRPASLDLPAFHDRRSHSTDDGFDSWDTSAVDPQNRQTVLESSSPPPGRFLETIPASPATSRSPSPGTPLDILEPPRTRRRSRSYSPVSTRRIQAQQAAFTQHLSQSEANIHPLFRSDSPTPPPLATPGTVVTAAPNAGVVISDRQSIRSIKSLTRMRSGSLPTVPSPLSHQGSFDSFRRRVDASPPEIREEEEASSAGPDTERKMTPPIPEWILTAGSRNSLTTYNTRKSRTPGGDEDVSGTEQRLS
ncbi:hypothetical protein N656DRAFT_788519 [Canariomyces notabilis]|uniref:Uncharacterized protein n=1 Tax=Canariomyces notabilis TaxID=2074819 RepID=A0AAN6TH26_9PEZI|nr:hypothetical protein N656DRAFT_788519 [Canariomyces arenarius]